MGARRCRGGSHCGAGAADLRSSRAGPRASDPTGLVRVRRATRGPRTLGRALGTAAGDSGRARARPPDVRRMANRLPAGAAALAGARRRRAAARGTIQGNRGNGGTERPTRGECDEFDRCPQRRTRARRMRASCPAAPAARSTGKASLLARSEIELAKAEDPADRQAQLGTVKAFGVAAVAALLGVNLLLVAGILALGLKDRGLARWR